MADDVVVETEHGRAIAHLDAVAGARGLLVLGHGAGGGVSAPDLTAAAAAARAVGLSVALVEQPYRVADRRNPAPAHQLDTAWTTVVAQLAGTAPVVVGGRSSGARVACRTAAVTNAAGVLCLAFPLVPPRRVGGAPPPSRLPELDSVEVPTLVVQGVNDRFGMPPPGPHRTVVQVHGDHSLRGDRQAISDAVGQWLGTLLGTA